ncbi:MAG: hypothetical protein LBF68_04175 [Christensenellaceae bacterium]|jgi:hypothetical protein|nr:hypothetical protein [Christensenellaceae bacterium]
MTTTLKQNNKKKIMITLLSLILISIFIFVMYGCALNNNDDNDKTKGIQTSGDKQMNGQVLTDISFVSNSLKTSTVEIFDSRDAFISYLLANDQSLNISDSNAFLPQYDDDFFEENIICYVQFHFTSTEFDASSDGDFKFLNIYESVDSTVNYIVFDINSPLINSDDIRKKDIFIKTSKSDKDDLEYEVRVINNSGQTKDSYYYSGYDQD